MLIELGKTTAVQNGNFFIIRADYDCGLADSRSGFIKRIGCMMTGHFPESLRLMSGQLHIVALLALFLFAFNCKLFIFMFLLDVTFGLAFCMCGSSHAINPITWQQGECTLSRFYTFSLFSKLHVCTNAQVHVVRVLGSNVFDSNFKLIKQL